MPLAALHHEKERFADSDDDGGDRPGYHFFSPDSMSDIGAKDDFANKVRLITASQGA